MPRSKSTLTLVVVPALPLLSLVVKEVAASELPSSALTALEMVRLKVIGDCCRRVEAEVAGEVADEVDVDTTCRVKRCAGLLLPSKLPAGEAESE